MFTENSLFNKLFSRKGVKQDELNFVLNRFSNPTSLHYFQILDDCSSLFCAGERSNELIIYSYPEYGGKYMCNKCKYEHMSSV